jgi:Flp pilus assembly protein TadB
MTLDDPQMREQELKNREKALQERELNLRLKELEVEINVRQSRPDDTAEPLNSSIPSFESNSSLRSRFNRFLKWSKLIGFAAIGLTIAFIGVFVGLWLVYLALLGGLGWISYQLLFGKKRTKH